jgi:hypothetical protein
MVVPVRENEAFNASRAGDQRLADRSRGNVGEGVVALPQLGRDAGGITYTLLKKINVGLYPCLVSGTQMYSRISSREDSDAAGT